MKINKIIGIVGGMGPESGNALFKNITSNTTANKDQEHHSIVLMSFPKDIVDRTAFLNDETSINPAYQVVEIIKKLEVVGADIIGIACNTMHSEKIFNVIETELNKTSSVVKLLNMPLETCNLLARDYPKIKRVGVMATNGTYNSGVYDKILKSIGYEVVLPDFSFQNNIIHRMVYDPFFGIKANPNNCTEEVQTLINKTLHFFRSNNTEAIILGCTEFSLVFPDNLNDIVLIDSSDSLAKALIKNASIEVLNTQIG